TAMSVSSPWLFDRDGPDSMTWARRRRLTPGAAGAAIAAGASPSVMAQDQPTVTVGSKNFAEQLIVGQMLVLLLEDAGFPVEQQMNLGGTIVAHEALVSGELDTYIEYSGTGLLAVLRSEEHTSEL